MSMEEVRLRNADTLIPFTRSSFAGSSVDHNEPPKTVVLFASFFVLSTTIWNVQSTNVNVIYMYGYRVEYRAVPPTHTLSHNVCLTQPVAT